MSKLQLTKTEDLANQSLNEYYSTKYGTPGSQVEAIDTLFKVYLDLVDDSPNQTEVKEGIGEYFRLLEQRGLCAFDWVLEAIHITSKKSEEKRNFNYIVGMIRNWMRYGFGCLPNTEEQEVISFFEEVTGVNTSPDARKVIENLLGTYGVVTVTRMIGEMGNSVDISLLKANALRDLVENRANGRVD